MKSKGRKFGTSSGLTLLKSVSTVAPGSLEQGASKEDSVRVWFLARKSKWMRVPTGAWAMKGGEKTRVLPLSRPTVTVVMPLGEDMVVVTGVVVVAEVEVIRVVAVGADVVVVVVVLSVWLPFCAMAF